MVKFHESSFHHSHPFETVTLAYFLRYPNPYANHVSSTDVISRHFDPATQTLYTARLHLKRSKIPSAILKLLPKSWLGAAAPGDDGTSQSYVLERSVVAVRDGVMVTESRNLDFVGVLAVVERQVYRRPGVDLGDYFRNRWSTRAGFRLVPPGYEDFREGQQFGRFQWRWPRDQGDEEEELAAGEVLPAVRAKNMTEVLTRVELHSRLGEGPRRRLLRGMFSRKDANTAKDSSSPGVNQEVESEEEEETETAQTKEPGFFASFTRASIQRSIEGVGLRRAERAVPNSKKGMNVVLDRLRKGGLVAVLEGMRRDREMAHLGLVATAEDN